MWVNTWSSGGCTTRWRTTTPWIRPVLTTSSPTSAGGRCSGADTTFMGNCLPLETIHITYSVVTLFVSDFFLRPKPLDLCLTDIASPCHVGAMVESNYNFWIPWMVGLFFLRFALVYEAHTSQEDCHSQFSCIYPGDLPVLSSNYEFISLQSVAPEIIDKQCWRSIGTAAACLFGLKNAVDKDSMPLLKSYNIQVMKS